MNINDVSRSVERYAQHKLWYWYVPLWLFGVYIFIQLFRFDLTKGQMPIVLLIPYSFDFMLHEISHIVTAFLPSILTASAGSLSELALGSVLIFLSVKQRSYFALLFCTLWFALACQSAGIYMADAVPQRLPLVSLGGALSGQDALHDWHFVFGQLHMLGASWLIGTSLRLVGMLVALAGVIFSAWVIYKMKMAVNHHTPLPDYAHGYTTHHYTAPRPQAQKEDDDYGFTSLPLDIPDPAKHGSKHPD